jgi:hypothetical protein
MEILEREFSFPNTGMICASYEAEIRRFKKIEANGKVWLVALQENAAENVYVHDPRDKNSQGFAGRTLTFQLEDGTEYAAKGPWQTSAGALFIATGYDVRDTHYTIGAIGLRKGESFMGVGDVVYLEKEPILGTFERVNVIAQRIADELNTVVYCLSKSSGGSSVAPIKPTHWTKERYDAFWKK